ncbi:MAG: FemAB-related protein system-associated [Fibrobacteres bacterium]|nr:FemAB-related protein system-associated [Fibrobacterota bacterium]
MTEEIAAATEADYRAFVEASPEADYCHDLGWREVIRETYGLRPFYLADRDPATGRILGVAPAFRLKGLLSGGEIVSMPFLDYGAPLSASPESELRLVDGLLQEAKRNAMPLELRSRLPLASLPAPANEKVSMVLELEGKGKDGYWKGLDAKVRNQVRKAEKSEVTVKWGREECLDEFYSVFAVNMRDLGSPVHSKTLFASLLRHFPGAQIGVAHRQGRCIGGLVRVLWKKTLYIPWASTLKEHRIHSANNALYWESIAFAFERGCERIDFGRSSKGEGTYKFKLQWEAREAPLCWYQFDAGGKPKAHVEHLASGKLKLAATVWARLPLAVANRLGPALRGKLSA